MKGRLLAMAISVATVAMIFGGVAMWISIALK